MGFGFGHWEILFIFLVILLVFGAKRIPEMAQGLGKGIKEFRRAMREVKDEIDVTAPPESPANNIQATAPTESAAQSTRDRQQSSMPDKTAKPQ